MKLSEVHKEKRWAVPESARELEYEPSRARAVVSAKPTEAPKSRSMVLEVPGEFDGATDDNAGWLYEIDFDIMYPIARPTEIRDDNSDAAPETLLTLKALSLDQKEAHDDEPERNVLLKVMGRPIWIWPL